MVTRNPRYGWMTVGGLLCLFALVLTCKVPRRQPCQARSAPLVPVANETPEPPRAMPQIESVLPDLAPPKTANASGDADAWDHPRRRRAAQHADRSQGGHG